MYHSKMKTKQVYLYDSTFATPFSLLLWGARVRHERPLGHTKKSSIEVIIGELLLRYAILKEQCRSCSLDGAQGFCGLLELAQLSVGAVLGLQHESEDRSFAISFPPYPPPRPPKYQEHSKFRELSQLSLCNPSPQFCVLHNEQTADVCRTRWDVHRDTCREGRDFIDEYGIPYLRCLVASVSFLSCFISASPRFASLNTSLMVPRLPQQTLSQYLMQ